jgi:hypothetical protein
LSRCNERRQFGDIDHACPKNNGVLKALTCDGGHSYQLRNAADCSGGRYGSIDAVFL